MFPRRHVFLVVALLTATALATSGGAFSTTAAERGVDIEIADDRNAYVGFEKTQRIDRTGIANASANQSSDGNQTTNGSVTQSGSANRTTNGSVTRGSDGNRTANVSVTQRDSGTDTRDVTVGVTNQFPAGTQLASVEVSADGSSVDLGPLASGERGTHTFPSVPCGESIGVEASGDGVTVDFERSVTCR